MRWGLGPVFVYDGLAASRRWQTYAVRTFGGALLLLAIFTVVSSRTRYDDASMSWREYAAIGESLFYGIIGVEITLVMLAAPAATAGAICVDRARGTLAHMLVTDLSDVEIVLGKLGDRILIFREKASKDLHSILERSAPTAPDRPFFSPYTIAFPAPDVQPKIEEWIFAHLGAPQWEARQGAFMAAAVRLALRRSLSDMSDWASRCSQGAL